MRNSIKAGMFWKFLERFGVSGIQFILQIILARLLSPEHYGALSIMIIFTNLANVFVQTGFNTSLIQKKNLREEDYSSVLWVSLGIAIGLYIIIFIASPWVAAFYDMPDIIWPMRLLAAMLIPGALNSVQLAKVSRELDFKKVFYSNIGAVIIAGIIGIIMAYAGMGLWALVAQYLLNAIIICFIMKVTVKLKIYFHCDFQRVKELFSFGWKLLVSSLIDTFYNELHSLVVGKKYDSGMLGYYNRGKQFPQFIAGAVNSTVQSVMLPAMSANQDDAAKVKWMVRNSITLSAYIMFPVMLGLAAVAEPVVRVLLTDKWIMCVPFMQIYCFTFAFYPIHSCNLQAINAIGRSDIFLKLEIIKKVYGLAFLILAVVLFDTPIAIALTGLITTGIGWFVNARPNKKLLGYAFHEQFKDILPSMVMSISMFIVVYLVGMLSINDILLLIIQILIGILFYLLLSLIFKPLPYKYLAAYVRKLLRKKHNKRTDKDIS